MFRDIAVGAEVTIEVNDMGEVIDIHKSKKEEMQTTSTSHQTNNREAESWNGEWSQKSRKWWRNDETERIAEMPFSPFPRANSSRRDLVLVARACS